MGTNYYALVGACPHCGRADSDNRYHIGKSSAGWCFSLHIETVYGDQDIRLDSFEKWVAFLQRPDVTICDEYGRPTTFDKLVNVITNRRWNPSPDRTEQFLADNHAETGPQGLLRHRVDGVHCVAHGEGTWDMIKGDFS